MQALKRVISWKEDWTKKEATVYPAVYNPHTGRKTVDETSPMRLSDLKKKL